jgi:hypothetical protein
LFFGWWEDFGQHEKRHLPVLWYYCDESYDKGVYTVAGLIAEATEWDAFEKRWHHVPGKFGVSRFHASHLNAKDHEFEGWTDRKSKQFTVKLIKRIVERRAHLVSCSVMREPYEKLPPLAKQRLGTPYELCFKHCITLAAEQTVPRISPNGQFSVIYDHNTDLGTTPVELFMMMKNDIKWAHRHKLGTCAPGSWQDYLPLQPADAVAFDTFKLLHQQSWKKVRISLRKILTGIEHIGVCFDEDVFASILPRVLAAGEGTIICVDPIIST